MLSCSRTVTILTNFPLVLCASRSLITRTGRGITPYLQRVQRNAEARASSSLSRPGVTERVLGRRQSNLLESEQGIIPKSTQMTGEAEMDQSSAIGGSLKGRIIDSIVKSASDKRNYRALVLPNELKVILISDNEADKASGALAVAAGSMNDPFELPGLAHFCEHMMFLGTEKYPDESGFDKFLREHAGMSNAYTSRDLTNYFFDVAPDHLSPALDRFAQFFICPLFNEDSTERELNAVDSENAKNVPSDGWRTLRIDYSTANPTHSYTKFGTGNRESLWTRPKERSIDTRQALMTFHQTYYSSNIMSLVVLGKESLDELQDLVKSLFSSVVNKRVEKPFWAESPYTPKELQIRIDIVPVKELRQLFIKFPVPFTQPAYKTCAMDYLSHLIGHEGPGSLLSLLKTKGWVNDLSAGATFPGRGFGIFSIHCQLSVEGWEHLDTIVQHIFQYLSMLRNAGPQQRIWEEIRDMKEIRFRFQDKQSPALTTQRLASKMQQDYPLEDVISAGHLITEFKPDIINDILKCLTPDNCRIITNSKENELKADRTEEWYGAKYSLSKIEPAVIEAWANCGEEDSVALPRPNEFIPSLFDLKQPHDNSVGMAPNLIVNSTLCTAWHHQDTEFLLPKADIMIELLSPYPRLSAREYALTSLLHSGVKDLLSESSYAATLAGLRFSVISHIHGLEVEISGYDHKIQILLDSVIDKILEFSCPDTRFEILKDKYERALKNFKDEEPRFHADWGLKHVLSQVSWTHTELLTALSGLTVEDLLAYSKVFISKLKLGWLISGNITEQEAKGIVSKYMALFEIKGMECLAPEELERHREIQLPDGSDLVFRREHGTHSNSCVAVYFQAGIQTDMDRVLIDLLTQVISQPCFSQLRTKEQLGYVVFARRRRSNGTHGLEILVQSSYHPEYLESRIDSFLHDVEATLTTMTDEDFLVHRKSLEVRYSEKHKTLHQRSDYLWTEITQQTFLFDRQVVQMGILNEIKREEVVAFFKKLVGPPVSEKGRLGVHIVSVTEDGAGRKSEVKGPHPIQPKVQRTPTPIEDPVSWKRQQGLYSHPVPAIPIPPINS